MRKAASHAARQRLRLGHQIGIEPTAEAVLAARRALTLLEYADPSIFVEDNVAGLKGHRFAGSIERHVDGSGPRHAAFGIADCNCYMTFESKA